MKMSPPHVTTITDTFLTIDHLTMNKSSVFFFELKHPNKKITKKKKNIGKYIKS